jgi:hypothetical protein
MSKNNGRVTIDLLPEEACVVLKREFWDHMVKWYTIMAEDTGDKIEKENWYSVIREVTRWVANTYYDPNEKARVVEDDDDEWD